MAQQLGPLEVFCDAPPYGIVHACRTVGFHRPEDVPWYRDSLFRAGHYEGQPGARQRSWKQLFQRARLGAPRLQCGCGRGLPGLAPYTFTFADGRKERYRLGQCAGCGTIYWDLE